MPQPLLRLHGQQILGAINDFVRLAAGIRERRTHVIGWEASASWEPIDGLVFSPSISYAKSEIDGHFRNLIRSSTRFQQFYEGVLRRAVRMRLSGTECVYAVSVYMRGDITAFFGGNITISPAPKGSSTTAATSRRVVDPVTGSGHVHEDLLRIRSHTATPIWRFRRGAGRSVGGLRRPVARGRGPQRDRRLLLNPVQHVNDVLLRYSGAGTHGLTVATVRAGTDGRPTARPDGFNELASEAFCS
jgi:hypothetical protein